MRARRGAIGLVLVAGLLLPAPHVAASLPEPPVLKSDAPKPPWARRRRTRIDDLTPSKQGLIDLSEHRPEPPTPDNIEVEPFARAINELCGWMPVKRPARYARWILEYSARFSVDPLLVAALMYSESMCQPKKDSDYGIGLQRINPGMHLGSIHKRKYDYYVLEDGSWQPRVLDIGDFLFYRNALLQARSSIYFTAAFLSVFEQQCPEIDGAFGSVPHRHFVSHFIWGDRVRGAGAEDRVLRARRRLVEYLTGQRPPIRGHWNDLALISPLDGAPRKLSSVMGADRDGGTRHHKGVDYISTYGEPVRAVADGVVTLAGADMRVGAARNLPYEEAKELKRSELGAGGLIVMVRHAGGLTSAYMHLHSYEVQQGDRVTAGQLIARVGRSGIKESPPHLHFELRYDGHHVDPVPHLGQLVIHPLKTYVGRIGAYEQKRRRRNRRRQRRRQRQQTEAAGVSP